MDLPGEIGAIRKQLEQVRCRGSSKSSYFYRPNGIYQHLERLRVERLFEALDINGSEEFARQLHEDRKFIILAIVCHLERYEDALRIIAARREISYGDTCLPLEKSAAVRLLNPELSDAFFEKQFSFCPMKLEGGKSVRYDDHRKRCPLPFVAECDEKGSGAYGRVYKVKIASGSLIHKNNTQDVEDKEYAWKKYSLPNTQKDDQVEWKVAQILLENTKHHDCLMSAIAAFHRGKEFGIILELATCDLQHIFDHQTSFKIVEEENRQKLLECASRLAGALKLLHEELTSPDGKAVSCWHLDLKPDNILVFGSDIKTMTWKISDFGISQFSYKDKSSKSTYRFDSVFEPIVNESHQRSTFMRRETYAHNRFIGAYRSPEAATGGKINEKSDIWSFGAILSLVLCFMLDREETKKFGQGLWKHANKLHDRFFLRGITNSVELNRWVTEGLKDLRDTFKRDGYPEYTRAAIGKTVDLIEQHMLRIKSSERKSASEIEEQLKEILQKWRNMKTSPKKPSNSRGDTDKRLRRDIRRLDDKIPKGAHACRMASYDFTDMLAFVANHEIRGFSLKTIWEKKEPDSLFRLQGSTFFAWNDFAFASYMGDAKNSEGPRIRGVAAIKKSDHFQIRLWNDCKNDRDGLVDLEDLLPVQRLAMTPDGEHVACVCQKDDKSPQSLKIVLYSFEELLRFQTDDPYIANLPTSESTPYVNVAEKPPGSPKGHIWPISAAPEMEDYTAIEVLDLRFNALGTVLTILASITKSPIGSDRIFFSWYTEGTKFNPFDGALITSANHEGGNDIYTPIMTPYCHVKDNDKWSLCYFSLGKFHILALDLPEKPKRGPFMPEATSIREIFVNPERDGINVYCVRSERGIVSACRIGGLGDLIGTKKLKNTMHSTLINSFTTFRDCAGVFEDPEGEGCVFIATREGKLELFAFDLGNRSESRVAT